jgi:hypothetical protein
MAIDIHAQAPFTPSPSQTADLVQKMVLGLLGLGIGPGTQIHDPGGASMMTLPLASAGTTDRLPSTRLKV